MLKLQTPKEIFPGPVHVTLYCSTHSLNVYITQMEFLDVGFPNLNAEGLF